MEQIGRNTATPGKKLVLADLPAATQESFLRYLKPRYPAKKLEQLAAAMKK